MTSPPPEAARRPRAVLAVASVAVALAAADTYVVVLALLDMMNGVGIGIDALQRATPIISGFLLGYVAVLPLVGRVADLVARHRVLQICLAVFVVGSAVTAMAGDLTVLVAGRVVQGMGGGGLVPATLALVADLWPVDRRGTPLGVVGAVQELGSVLGPVLGAAVLVVADWRAIFWLNAVAGVVLSLALAGTSRQWPAVPSAVGGGLAGAALVTGGLALWAPQTVTTSVSWGAPFVPLGSSDSVLATPIGLVALLLLSLALARAAVRSWPVLRHADLPGAVLAAVSLGALVLTFASAEPETEVIGPLGWSLLPVGVLAAVGYLWRHRRCSEPLIPRGVVRGRVRWALAVSFLVGTALVAVVVTVPLLARLTGTTSQEVAALHLVKFLVAVPVGAVLGGWSLRRTADGPVSAAGMAMAGVGLLAMSRWGDGSLASQSGTLTLALVGLGVGTALAPVNNAALADAPARAHGTASALVVVARMVGMVVGLALLTAIGLHRYYLEVAALDAVTVDALVQAGLVQVRTMFLAAAVAALLAAAASAGLGARRRAEIPVGA